MKLLQLAEAGVLDYRGDMVHPATQPGAPLPAALKSGAAGAGTNMTPEEPDKTLLQKAKGKKKKRSKKKPR